MSVELTSRVWKLELDHAEQSVALALADWANDDGTSIFPSLALVAWKTGYSERQVRRIVRRLEDQGLLIQVRKPRQHRPSEYRMDVTAVRAKPPFRADILSPPDAESGVQGGHPGSPRADISSLRADIAVSPEPSLEPPAKSNHQDLAPAAHTQHPVRVDDIWETLGELYGQAQSGDKDRNDVVAQLRRRGFLADDILGFVGRCSGTDDDWAVKTPRALLKHIGNPQLGAVRVRDRAAEIMRNARRR